MLFAPLYKGKEERLEYRIYKEISLLSVTRKIYARVLVDSVRSVT